MTLAIARRLRDKLVDALGVRVFLTRNQDAEVELDARTAIANNFKADLFVSIGTSGAVYPAAGFVQDASELGARTLELNLERSQGSHWFDESRQGPATQLVPQWVDELLAGG